MHLQQKCDFDDFLRYFLSLCLEGDARKTFELQQNEIEDLQKKRHKHANEDKINQPRKPEDEGEPTEKEKDLVAKRDKSLDDLLQKCLQKVLTIANDAEIKEKLRAFSDSLSATPEMVRYASYADVYNYALDKLAGLSLTELFLRSPAEHELRTTRSDPSCITSRYEGMPEKGKVNRKPDLIRTSKMAAASVRTRADATFGEQPESGNNFLWSQVLSCDEMKASPKKSAGPEAKAALHPEATFGVHRKVEVAFVDFTIPDDEQVADETVPAPSSTKSGLKRSLGDTTDQPRSKKSRTSYRPSHASFAQSTSQIQRVQSDSAKQVSARVQLAGHAMEMLSYGVGVRHVINTLVVDDHFWIWYYDRQGTIQSNGISFIADFPRALVLMLAFQRFTLEDWGIVPCLNEEALRHLGVINTCYPTEDHRRDSTIDQQSGTTTGLPPFQPRRSARLQNAEPTEQGTQWQHRLRPRELLPKFGLKLTSEYFEPGHLRYEGTKEELEESIVVKKDYLSHQPQPHCISGRATSVLNAASGKIELACKLYNPEVQRPHEGETLRLVHAICNKKDPNMKKHLPEPFFSADFKGCSTMRVRSVLGLNAKGFRALRILILRKLVKITKYEGSSFVRAWFEALTCHSFLWKHGIEHGDPSLWNVMYDPEEECGVLTDFDLSIIQWLPRIPGTDRTGTIPFMAIDLLCKDYLDGKLIRYYHHELEAFIWTLSYVFLANAGGVFDRDTPYIHPWMTSDYAICQDKKQNFISRHMRPALGLVQDGFKEQTPLMKSLCTMLRDHYYHQAVRADTMPPSIDFPPPFCRQTSQDIWISFISTLKRLAESMSDLTPFIGLLEVNKPEFDPDLNITLFVEMRKIYETVVEETT